MQTVLLLMHPNKKTNILLQWNKMCILHSSTFTLATSSFTFQNSHLGGLGHLDPWFFQLPPNKHLFYLRLNIHKETWKCMIVSL